MDCVHTMGSSIGFPPSTSNSVSSSGSTSTPPLFCVRITSPAAPPEGSGNHSFPPRE